MILEDFIVVRSSVVTRLLSDVLNAVLDSCNSLDYAPFRLVCCALFSENNSITRLMKLVE